MYSEEVVMNTHIVSAAVAAATKLHAGQFRKQRDADGNRIPYINHLLLTRRIVAESEGDDAEQDAAVLHDAIEDCDPEEAEKLIRALPHGEEIFQIVQRCSHQRDKSIPWRERMKAEIDDIPDMPISALHVKIADELANLMDLFEAYCRVGDDAFAIFKKSHESLSECKERMMWFHRSCVEAFKSVVLPHNIAALIPKCEHIVDSLLTNR